MRDRGQLDEAVKKLEATKGKDWTNEITKLKGQIDTLYERVAALEAKTPKKE